MRRLRHIADPKQLREITCRLNHGQFLFKPSRKFNRIFKGILGRAQKKHGMRICAYVVMSSHFHILVQPGTAKRLADFMGYLNGNLSKEVGRLYGVKGPKYQRRYSDIPVSDEKIVQINRLRYLLSNSSKEGLVSSPLKWPGVHSARAMVFGKNDSGTWFSRTNARTGTWFSRTNARTAKNQRRKPKKEDIETNYEIYLSPLPCWARFSKHEHRCRVLDLIRGIEVDTRAMHQEKGTQPLGKKAVIAMDPLHIPDKVAYSEAPPIHVRSKEMRKLYFEAYHTFLSAYRKAAENLKAGVDNPQFPENCFPPGLPYVRGPDLPN